MEDGPLQPPVKAVNFCRNSGLGQNPISARQIRIYRNVYEMAIRNRSTAVWRIVRVRNECCRTAQSYLLPTNTSPAIRSKNQNQFCVFSFFLPGGSSWFSCKTWKGSHQWDERETLLVDVMLKGCLLDLEIFLLPQCKACQTPSPLGGNMGRFRVVVFFLCLTTKREKGKNTTQQAVQADISHR